MGLGISLAAAPNWVVQRGWFGRVPYQLLGFEPSAPQESLQLIGRESDRVPRVPSLDAQLDCGGARPQMGDVLRTQITLQVGRSWMQMISVAIWELEPDERLGWRVNGSRGGHEGLTKVMVQTIVRHVNRA
jgi:hypothetical protein